MSDSQLARLTARVSDTSRMFGGRRRKRAAEKLAVLGTSEAMAVLADAFVNTTDPHVGEIARDALQGVREQDAIDAVADVAVTAGDERLANLLVEAGPAPSDPGRHAVVLFLAGEFDRYTDLDFDGSLLRGASAGAGEALRLRLAEQARAGGRLEWVRAVASGTAHQAGRVSDPEWGALVQTLMAARRWDELWRLALDAPVTRAAPVVASLGDVRWRPDGTAPGDYAELVRLATRARDSEVPATTRFGEKHLRSIAAPPVQAMAVTRDGRLLVTGSYRARGRLWSVSSGTTKREFGSQHMVTMTFTPDGKLLITGDMRGVIKLWNFPSGTLAGEYSHTMAKGNAVLARNLLTIVPSPDATLLATGGYGPNIQLWRLSSGTLTRTATLHADPLWVPCMAITPDGGMLVSGGQKGNLRLWKLPSGTPLRTLDGHTDHVGAVAVTPDGSLLASGGYDGTVRLWHLPSGEPAGVLTGHTSLIRALAMTPDGTLLASGGKDRVVRLWHLPSGEPAGELRGHRRGIIECMAVTPDGSMLASATTNGHMLWWTRRQSKLHALVRTPLSEVNPDEIRRSSHWSDEFSPAERAWFDLASALVKWRHRHDVELLDASYADQAASHDVELTDDDVPQRPAPQRRPNRPKRKRKGKR
ncbi:WD40 repeat domain-containing protein [Actinomadura darangshiensis]|uniref:WD40 repeat domain-containing protein n=1 Tax=Actinomadura darangshiensis TaxID=705336 RepID=A0A4R5BMC2_9ACTN|nr:WD40 repeat domain-containing protein [Actinomadura darangshiensis]TDD87948.1 WD40 repeat domain-containing protein [Actinomadura darangshiensis]